MFKLYLYGYFNKSRSSRQPEHETQRHIEVIWLWLAIEGSTFQAVNSQAWNLSEKKLQPSLLGC